MTPPLTSALFPGHVTHARLKPKTHKLAYRIYSLLLDLDELNVLDRKLRFFSVDRFNLFSFHSRDRGNRSAVGLRQQIESAMTAAGMAVDGGPIRLLTMPRVLGWAFNPLSVFFCYGRDLSLKAILWEVDNTFGERHSYLIPVEAGKSTEIVQQCDKAFYVSPFMDMDLHYVFRVAPPGTNLARLRELLPQCDVLLVTTTQQKYRSARVNEELAAAATGARLIFVQTHADTDEDIRADWRRVLAPTYQVSEMFFVDSPAALADAQAGMFCPGTGRS